MQEKQFKYQNWIDELAELGCLLPPLYPPGNMQACRFVFSSDEHRNHIPQYIAKDLTLRELIENPNDGFLYSVDI